MGHAGFRAVMVANPWHPTTLGGANRDDLVRRAKLALHGDRQQEALRLAEEILKTDPRHAEALYVLGCALLMLGRAADAVSPLETATRSLRKPETDTLLAIALSQSGRNDEALLRLKRTTRRRPPYVPAFLELGCLLLSLRRYDEAAEALRRGVEIAPMMPEMSIQLGYVLLRQMNWADAKLAFRGALNISPASPDALFGMARAHQEIGENEPAADYFRRYLRLKPDDAGSWLNLGHCLLELGQIEAGYGCFRAAARGDPKRYGTALSSLAASARGKLWLKPSAAARFLRGSKN